MSLRVYSHALGTSETHLHQWPHSRLPGWSQVHLYWPVAQRWGRSDLDWVCSGPPVQAEHVETNRITMQNGQDFLFQCVCWRCEQTHLQASELGLFLCRAAPQPAAGRADRSAPGEHTSAVSESALRWITFPSINMPFEGYRVRASNPFSWQIILDLDSSWKKNVNSLILWTLKAQRALKDCTSWETSWIGLTIKVNQFWMYMQKLLYKNFN